MFLMVEKIKYSKVTIDKEIEFEKMFQFEQNKQLNNFSKFILTNQNRLINFYNNLKKTKLNNKYINLINVNFDKQKVNNYIKDCFDLAFKVLSSKFTYKFINNQVNKSSFLNKKYLGITEYIAQRFNVKKMLC